MDATKLRSFSLLILAACLLGVHSAVAATLPYKSITWKTIPTQGAVVELEVNVTLSYGAPNCFARPIILVNGLFEPAIEVSQGDLLKITLNNFLPATYPTISDGISIHYHGLNQRGRAAWFDGVSYVNLCPIAPGTSFSYQFEITDPPGSYLWHDHSAGFKGDGLNGPFIIRPRRVPPPYAPTVANPSDFTTYSPDLWQYDAEHTLFIADWYNAPMSALLMRLNPPFDAAKADANTNTFQWIGNPQTVLVNGKGFYGDCPLYSGLGAGTPPNCSVTTLTVPAGRSAWQPWASANNPGCTHEVLTVAPGKTYRLRLISSTLLVYTSVCFHGHTVKVIAADATPTDMVEKSCVDINSGQRVDVLLTANQAVASYWITVVPQYRPGSPAGFALLKYEGADSALPSPSLAAPTTTAPWSLAEAAQIVTHADLLKEDNLPAAGKQYLHYGQRTLAPPKPAAVKVFTVNFSQPLIQADGSIKWALNNVVQPRTPPCKPLMSMLRADPKALRKAEVDPSKYNGTAGMIQISMGTANKAPVYIAGSTPVPVYPSIGQHILELKKDEVIDVVINNGPANGFNGDYRPGVGASRVAQEQHPFHLHGHHFWILGSGLGVFNPSTHSASLNLANPSYRDVITVPQGGWSVIRFVANNPGVWPFHCHILPHMYMGQAMNFVEDIGNLAKPPTKQPKCPSRCRYSFAPYTKDWLRRAYGRTGWELPPL